MVHDIAERIRQLYPDLEELKRQITERLQRLNVESGEQIRGQERVIVVGKNADVSAKLRTLFEKELVSDELAGIDRLIRGYPLSSEHISALEAIIEETMPFLVIKSGDFELPLDWKHLEPQYAFIQDTVASVGRIGNAGGDLYWGTGFLVAPDIIMTNWHVICGHVYPQNCSWQFYPHLNVEIDFRMEYNTSKPFKIRCIEVIGKHPKYDLTLLRTERKLDEFSPLTLSAQPPEDLQSLLVYLVGHPYVDSRLGASLDIQRKLFLMGQTVGFKHLLLGYTEPLIPYKPDPYLDFPKMLHLSHTGSTLPGNSGSCVVDALNHKVIGLHCAGDNINKRNYAVPLWKIKEDKIFQETDVRFK